MSASVPSPTPDYFTRKVSSGRIRVAATPGSPHTPALNRSISSLYTSPGASFRNEDENNIVVDLGARFMRIGVAGETSPRCVLGFSPNDQRRVGDYRHWMPGYQAGQKRKRGHGWIEEWELYSNDIRHLDLGLIGDKLERACRKADGEILMLDDRKKRLTAVVSSLLPRPVLSVTLETLFNAFQTPSITLLPTSIAGLVGSGLRSGIVLDIGWSESVATVVFEYREIVQRRSVRAGKLLSQETDKMLDEVCSAQAPSIKSFSFEDVQEVLTRLAWCRNQHTGESVEGNDQQATIEISLPSSPATTISIPFERLSEPSEVLFTPSSELSSASDAHDATLPHLLFDALFALPIDVRKVCISRIIITGGGSHIPGLKSRIGHDLKRIIQQRGWDPVHNYGKILPKKQFHAVLDRHRANTDSSDESTPDSDTHNSQLAIPKSGELQDKERQGGEVSAAVFGKAASEPSSTSIPASKRSQESDPVFDKIQAQQKKPNQPEYVEGEVRLVETLGAWPGASLLASLRIKGVVEIERDTFMKDGIHGAQGVLFKETEGERKKESRKSLGGAKAVAEKSFNLGIWA